jgi:hypothetical protein
MTRVSYGSIIQNISEEFERTVIHYFFGYLKALFQLGVERLCNVKLSGTSSEANAYFKVKPNHLSRETDKYHENSQVW